MTRMSPIRTAYLATYVTPRACYRYAPVRRITDEERRKDNAMTFRIERGVIDAAHRARSNIK